MYGRIYLQARLFLAIPVICNVCPCAGATKATKTLFCEYPAVLNLRVYVNLILFVFICPFFLCGKVYLSVNSSAVGWPYDKVIRKP